MVSNVQIIENARTEPPGEPQEPDVDTLCLCLLSLWQESRFLSAAFCDLSRKKEEKKKNALEDFENPQHLLEI